VVNPLRVAFVGSGSRSLQSARMLAGSGIGEPVGFWNRTREVAESAAAEFATAAYDEIDELIERTGPDLVAIMTHPSARSELVDAAVSAGSMAILIEKPVALTLGELERVEAVARDAFVMVNTQYQWMPHWQRYLAIVGCRALGEIRAIRVSVGVDILEQGPHALSLAMAVAEAAGLPGPTWVLAGAGGSFDFAGVDVPADTVATFDMGEARLSLVAGSVAPPVPGETVRGFQQQTDVVGDLGQIWVSLNQGSHLWLPNGHEDVTTEWDRDDYASQTGLFVAVAAALVDPDLRASFPTRLEVAARQARMLFGAIESARTGRRVTLD